MTDVSGRIRPVILSGGSGTRLWPLSRPDRPKQFLALTESRSMLQLTLQRVAGNDAFDPPMIVASGRHEMEIERQLEEIGFPEVRRILEPSPRNTAAAIALAALDTPADQALLVMPSDHVIRDVERFRAAVTAALPVTAAGYLVTFGINPSGPETGFGYIKRGAPIAPGIFEADQFVEKPDQKTAHRYVECGEFSWNAGIFLFRAGDYLAALAEHAPDILAASKEAVLRGVAEADRLRPDAVAFATAPSVSIDYAVMEKSSRVAVMPIDVGWSDIGSWDALYDFIGSTCEAETEAALSIDSSGCLTRSDGPLIATVGVNDLIVVATDNAVLVMARGDSQRVKQVVELLEHRQAQSLQASGAA